MLDDLKNALTVLQQGGVILYPTDTIWGLGCDATNQAAVKRIYEIKQRTDNKSMLVLIDTETRLIQYVEEVPEVAWELIEVADKPLTIVYPRARNLAPNLVAEDGSVGIRIPRDKFCQQLISKFRKPIVSTSANPSGQASPALFSDIQDQILKQVDYIVCWRQEDISIREASSVIWLGRGGEIKIIRK